MTPFGNRDFERDGATEHRKPRLPLMRRGGKQVGA